MIKKITQLFYNNKGIKGGVCLSARQLGKRYIFALSLVALLVVSSQIILQSMISDQTHDSRVINIAGRQRMLSQKISKTHIYLIRSSIEEKQKYRDILEKDISVLISRHEGLQHGDKLLGLPGHNTKEIMMLFEKIQPHYLVIVSVIRDTIINQESPYDENKIIKMNIAEAEFLKIMDEIVQQYELEAYTRVNFIKNIEYFIMFITLFVLFIEAKFIFAPAVRKIQEDTKLLLDAKAELEKQNEIIETEVELRTSELNEAKDAANAANRAKSVFLANMSHEIRTPMNGVMGMTELAKHKMTDPKGLEYLNKVEISAKRLLGILNDILDISKIEDGRITFEDNKFKLNEIIDNVCMTLGDSADQKNLYLGIDVSSELTQIDLMGDQLRLGQILINLVGNAIKFTEHGKVILRAKQIDETLNTITVRFEISDDGIGISQEAQSRLFTAFEQADNSITRKYGGTGLGLTICKQLITMLGGTIGVESALGKGSTFWFIVPLKKYRHTNNEIKRPTAHKQSVTTTKHSSNHSMDKYAGTKVLLAEDDHINREIVRIHLENSGIIVDIAEDGMQALMMCRQYHYSLILMDMQMPNMDGLEATKNIRDNSLNQKTPIIAITANVYETDKNACITSGMNAHIGKPIDLKQLFETMIIWLDKK